MAQTLTSSTTTPLTPPKLEEDRLSWLRLYRSRRVGATTFFRLLADHGSAAAALQALPDIARAAGVEDYAPCPVEVALAELKRGARAGARLVLACDPDYPARLVDLEDAPPLIWLRGDASLLARPAVALVGARSASSLGERMARRLAADLGAAGYVVVSGLARGIDRAAHLAALDTGTVAILGGGIDVTYPAENADLQDRIGEAGLLLTEQPPGLQPQARHFPRRNRIVSGLAGVLVVVEAAARSGSLITARCALDQGREVMAVPGHPLDGRASGCNLLIRDGATLVRSAEDVIEALDPDDADAPASRPQARRAQVASARTAAPGPVPAPPSAAATTAQATEATGDLADRILDRLGPSPLGEDQLLRDLGLPAQAVAPALLDLELEGLVERHPGGLLSRVT